MSTAILYIRVSTDEQAAKGYSQRYQKEHLERYCQQNRIEILDMVFEDYSAKNFERPGWKMLMADLKSQKSHRPDYLLFTKWDRFSRNVGDAYYVITQLKNWGIEPQAIDQKLDLSVPENKIILSVYLSTSEAENDRRSMNVKEGIHKAREEGRCTAHVPFGYTGVLIENNKRGMVPKEPEATFVRQAYDMVSEGVRTVQAIYDMLKSRGLGCGDNQFRRILSNPFYCGKISVPEFGGKKAYWVQGLHAGLVSEAKFLEAQKMLDKKRRKIFRRSTDEQMVLRGFIHCPRCRKRLTGSISKGKTKYYPYYHCSGCGFRIRADVVNQKFETGLGELRISEEYIGLCKKIVRYVRQDLEMIRESNGQNMSQSIDRLIERIVKAKQFLLNNELEYDDYLLIRRDCEKRIHDLGNEMKSVSHQNRQRTEAAAKVVASITNIGEVFQRLDMVSKRKFLRLVLRDSAVIKGEVSLCEPIRPVIMQIFKIESLPGERKNLNNPSLVSQSETTALGEYGQFIKEALAIVRENGETVSWDNAEKKVVFLKELIQVSSV